jgi:hypothetical protein
LLSDWTNFKFEFPHHGGFSFTWRSFGPVAAAVAPWR